MFSSIFWFLYYGFFSFFRTRGKHWTHVHSGGCANIVMREGSQLFKEYRQGYGILLHYRLPLTVKEPVAVESDVLPTYNSICDLLTKQILDEQPAHCENVVNNNVVDVNRNDAAMIIYGFVEKGKIYFSRNVKNKNVKKRKK